MILGSCVHRCILYKSLSRFSHIVNLFRSILTPWDLAPTIATLEALPFRVKKCTSLFLNKQLS